MPSWRELFLEMIEYRRPLLRRMRLFVVHRGSGGMSDLGRQCAAYVISGGTIADPVAANETTRVHHASRRHGSLAARCAWAAAGAAGSRVYPRRVGRCQRA